MDVLRHLYQAFKKAPQVYKAHLVGLATKPGASLHSQGELSGWKGDPTLSGRPRAVIIVPIEYSPTVLYAGMRMILFLANSLAERGYDILFIANQAEPLKLNDEELRRLIETDLGHAISGNWGCVGLHDADWKQLVHADDIVVATFWTTFIHAKEAAALTRLHLPVYLIQDDERLFYPSSSEFLEVLQTYKSPAHRIFSGKQLARYFIANKIVTEDPDLLHAHYKMFVDPVFCNAGNRRKEERQEHRNHKELRLCFYGRRYNPRLGYSTILKAIAGLRPNELPCPLRVYCLGSDVNETTYPNGIRIESMGKLTLAEYATFLTTMDLGVSLNFTPQSSMPPLEMTAAGLKVISNVWTGKNLPELAPSIRAVDLTETDLSEVIMEELQSISLQDQAPVQDLNAELITSNPSDVMAQAVDDLLSRVPLRDTSSEHGIASLSS